MIVIKPFINIILCVVTIVLLLSPGNILHAAQNRLAFESMVEGLVEREKSKGHDVEAFKRLTRLFFDYLESFSAPEVLQDLYQSGDLQQLRTRISKHFGGDVLDFGEAMFAFFERRAETEAKNISKTWKTRLSGHFIFFYRPGSIAEKDMDSIEAASEESFRCIVQTLDLSERIERTLQVMLASEVIEGNEIQYTGKIPVFLYQTREDAEEIGQKTMGTATFGATIASGGSRKGWGCLTARINVLYFNEFSQVVIDHEIGHIVLMLALFDPAAMQAKPLSGKSDLRKAFFAGYKPVLPFLHEGMGDYLIFYHGLYAKWPLLPRPEKLVTMIMEANGAIPLKTLLRKDLKYRMMHHKAFSLQGATFVRYLLDSYGKSRLNAFFLAGKDGIKSFRKIFGADIEEMEKDWRNWLIK